MASQKGKEAAAGAAVMILDHRAVVGEESGISGSGAAVAVAAALDIGSCSRASE